MKKIFSTAFYYAVISISVCFLTLCKKSNEGTYRQPDPPPGDTTTYQLVWSDEFDDDSIHTTAWNFERGGNGWGNNEQEFYQEANASIESGNLVITAKKETVGPNGYTSARMTTQGKKEFEFGRMEARIQLPMGKGLWPAFWMLGANISTVGWPKCGEIDIMEHINTEDQIYGTLHWDNNGHVQDGRNTTSSPAAYHVYSIEWNATTVKWYIDSVEYGAVVFADGTEEFQKPFFFIVNLAVGGNWPGQEIDDSVLPAKMLVDYVRVYQKK